MHFCVLSYALEPAASGSTASCALADDPLVKIAEFGLVFLLAVHMFGGPAAAGAGVPAMVARGRRPGRRGRRHGLSLVAGAFFLQAV